LAILLAPGCARDSNDLLQQAENDLRMGRVNQARQKIDQATLQDSTSPITLYGKALIDDYHGYEWDALIAYFEAIKIDRSYLPALEKFTHLAIRLDQLDNARSMASHIIKTYPENPEGYLFLATIDNMKNRSDSARAYLAKAEPLLDDPTRVLLLEAEIAFRTNDSGAASDVLNRLSEIQFKTAGQLRNLASLFSFLNMSDSAVYYMQKALDKDKNDISLKLQLGRYLLDDKHLDAAFKIAEDVYSTAEECGPACWHGTTWGYVRLL
jgi:tetratricopeptide (TPR) repeat protein